MKIELECIVQTREIQEVNDFVELAKNQHTTISSMAKELAERFEFTFIIWGHTGSHIWVQNKSGQRILIITE
jgi:hypothetical protein